MGVAGLAAPTCFQKATFLIASESSLEPTMFSINFCSILAMLSFDSTLTPQDLARSSKKSFLRG